MSNRKDMLMPLVKIGKIECNNSTKVIKMRKEEI